MTPTTTPTKTPWIKLADLSPSQRAAVAGRRYGGHPSNWPKPGEWRDAYRFVADGGWRVVAWSCGFAF